MIRYVSTRGTAPSLGFADTTLAGLARDGGLYVPEAWPVLTAEDGTNLQHQSYVEAAWRVLTPFTGSDIDATVLARLLQKAYTSFNHPDIAPLSQLEDGLHLLELYHGPTLAFKDIALQFLGQVFAHILKERDQRVTIVGATSGDTGSAALHAFAGQFHADMIILHPKGRVSEMQRRQMTTVTASNTHNIAIEGDFDDCQRLVKDMFADQVFRDEMRLSAINSINWARIAAQVVYYVTSSVRIHARTGKRATFVVPTGNFGNIYAGYVARLLGAPVGKLVAATNNNDILHRFFSTGEMKRGGVIPSHSPSMDIQVASNFERLLFELYQRHGGHVAETMRHFAGGGSFRLEDELMDPLRQSFDSGRCTDEQTLTAIADVYKVYDRLIDPHTAVGVHVARKYRLHHPEEEVITLATAHPAKFDAAVEKAVGIRPELPTSLAGLMDMPEKYVTLPNDLAAVQKHIRGWVRKA